MMLNDDELASGYHPFFAAGAWRWRLAIWCGAVTVGLVIATMTVLSERAYDVYLRYFHAYPLLTFVVAPPGMALTVWLTRRFFPGTDRSGIPQIKVALAIVGDPEKRSKLVSLRIAVGKQAADVQ